MKIFAWVSSCGGRMLGGMPCAALPILMGCIAAKPAATIQVVDYSDTGQVRQYDESFEECVYDIDGAGNLRLVMHRGGAETIAGDPYRITQVLYVDGIWHSVAGKNPFHRTQINGIVNYAVTGRGVSGTFEGAGAVHFSENAAGKELTGTIDHAVVLPQRTLTSGEPVFTKAEISGQFKAQRDPRRVVRLTNDVNRLFGPLALHSDHESLPKTPQP